MRGAGRKAGPYRDPNNFDCSGLTLWAYRQAGITLGPDTYTQIKDGQQVAPGNPQAGGLIFPKYSWDSRGPGHVQMAISPTEAFRRRPLRQPSWQARHLASSGLHQGGCSARHRVFVKRPWVTIVISISELDWR